MIVTLDVGNTHICLTVYEKDKPLFFARLKTDATRTENEYAIVIRQIFDLNHVKTDDVSGGIISCVVPTLTPILKEACNLLFHLSPLVVGPGIKTGINIAIDDPSSCGADLVCTAVGAAQKYPLPAFIIDLGTANKITVVDEKKNFLGGMISPGVHVSLNALSASAALLPTVGISGDVKVIGSNTVDCIVSGSVLGTASMIDGMIDRYTEKIPQVKTIVACGGYANTIIPHCKHEILVDTNLLSDGMLAIYHQNRN